VALTQTSAIAEAMLRQLPPGISAHSFVLDSPDALEQGEQVNVTAQILESKSNAQGSQNLKQ